MLNVGEQPVNINVFNGMLLSTLYYARKYINLCLCETLFSKSHVSISHYTLVKIVSYGNIKKVQ